MTILDLVSRFEVTRQCSRSMIQRPENASAATPLFDTLETVAKKYGLNLEEFLTNLAAAVG